MQSSKIEKSCFFPFLKKYFLTPPPLNCLYLRPSMSVSTIFFCWIRNGQLFQPSIILENIHNKIFLKTNFLQNASSPPSPQGAPRWIFSTKIFNKCLSLSQTNPKICIVTPIIRKIHCRQELVKQREERQKLWRFQKRQSRRYTCQK